MAVDAEESRSTIALVKETSKEVCVAFVSEAKSECREERRACLQKQLLNKMLQEVVISNKVELPLFAVPLYHSSILKEDKHTIAQKVSQNIIQAWHKIQQVTKDLPHPTTDDTQPTNTTSPWSQYDQLLVSTITSIQVLIDEHLLKEDPTERKYTNHHADAIHLKINLLANEVLLLTYQHLQVLALKEIHKDLISARSQLQNELNTASQMLAMYNGAGGSEFSSLAQEYHQTLAEITHKQWALSELATSK